ncbi:MAG: hypothetical protein ACRCYC_03220 [Paraclostridium sp.]|uniref:hypothetical protein n=1 Tax=Paraclostridium sp. TaxID=2023273 RepID=UPI003F3E0605
MKKKLKSKNGSAMVLAMIVIVLASIVMLILSKQILNQIKITKNTQDSIQTDYNVQGNIEEGIGDFISQVSIEGNNKSTESNSTGKIKYEASQSIVYRIGRDVKANLLEAQLINKQLEMPDKVGNNINSEGKYIDGKSTYPEIGKILKEIYFDKTYKSETGKKSPIDYVINQGEYINGITEEKQKNIVDALTYINQNLSTVLNNEELNGGNPSTDKQLIKNLIQQSQDYISYLINQLNSEFIYFQYGTTLDSEHINIISNQDINQLTSELDISINYLEKIVKSTSNLKDLDLESEKDKKSIEFIEYMLYTMKDVKDSDYINSLKIDIQKLKDCNNYDQKLNQVLKISSKLDSLYIMIGKYNYEKEIMNIHKNGVASLDAGKEYGISLSEREMLSTIRVYSQFARRYIKSTQVQLKYMKYKINKGLINEYIIDDEIQKNINSTYNNIEKINDYNMSSKKIKDNCDSILNQREKLESNLDIIKVFGAKDKSNWWNGFWKWIFGNDDSQNAMYLNYDKTIGDIVVNLDYLLDKSESIEQQLKDLKNSISSNADKAQIDNFLQEINKSINLLIKTRYEFNSVWSEGDHYIQNRNEDGKLSIKFPQDFTTLKDSQGGNVKVSLNQVRVNGIDYTLRVKPEGGYNIIETSPGNDIYIDISLESKDKKLKKPIKSKVEVSITSLKTESDYDINYKVLEWKN